MMEQNENNEHKIHKDDLKFIDDDDKKKIINENAKSDVLINSPTMNIEFEKSIVLPWDRFTYWAHAILVVTFDLELGQSLEVRIFVSRQQLFRSRRPIFFILNM